jgi:hypothetical protein
MPDQKLMTVTSVKIDIPRGPLQLIKIMCECDGTTPGWTNIHLSPFVYVKPPADGIYEFDLVGTPPTGIVNELITHYIAEVYVWKNYPKDLKGIKVYAAQNSMIKTLDKVKP